MRALNPRQAGDGFSRWAHKISIYSACTSVVVSSSTSSMRCTCYNHAHHTARSSSGGGGDHNVYFKGDVEFRHYVWCGVSCCVAKRNPRTHSCTQTAHAGVNFKVHAGSAQPRRCRRFLHTHTHTQTLNHLSPFPSECWAIIAHRIPQTSAVHARTFI